MRNNRVINLVCGIVIVFLLGKAIFVFWMGNHNASIYGPKRRIDLVIRDQNCNVSTDLQYQFQDLLQQQTYAHLNTKNRPECIAGWREQNLTDSYFLPVEKMPDVFVYTAYLDERISDRLLVRVYAYKLITRKVDLFCHFLDEHGGSVSIQESAKASGYGRGLHKIKEWMYVKWSGYMMTCTLPANGDHCSLFVSTSSETLTREQLQLRGAVQLPLRSTATVAKPKKRALCVRNLHSTQDLPLNLLVENIHYAFLSGVDIVVFYLSETPSNALASLVSTFNELKLQDRRNNRSLDLRFVPWFLPKPEETFAFNQPLLTNDCMMRTMPEAVFIQFHDIDEIFVPGTKYESFTKAVDAYFTDYPKSPVMRLINRYHPITQYMYDEQDPNRPFTEFLTKVKNHYLLRIADGGLRCNYDDTVQTKCVIKPREILEMNVHEPWLSIANHFVFSSPADPKLYGSMRHFRRAPIKYCGNSDVSILIHDSQHQKILPTDWRNNVYNRLNKILDLCHT
ncbi:hypothetical protein Ciccas_007050 [Cichlidogyrus casuarinus]|uniref:Glycosyltransferase family 92 protein n=1 Tax=Cichlidogyrus casuarinus TaxID=1844966 RepID=A0ABD2Q4A0_9PLAT